MLKAEISRILLERGQSNLVLARKGIGAVIIFLLIRITTMALLRAIWLHASSMIPGAALVSMVPKRLGGLVAVHAHFHLAETVAAVLAPVLAARKVISKR